MSLSLREFLRELLLTVFSLFLTYSCEQRPVEPVQQEPEHHGCRGEGVDEGGTHQQLELGALIGQMCHNSGLSLVKSQDVTCPL